MRHLSFFVLLLFAPNLHAQLVVPGAGAGKFSLLVGGNAIAFDAGEAKLSVSFAKMSTLTARNDCDTLPSGPAQNECMQDNSLKSDWFVETSLGVAAQKGKRALFSENTLTPGFDASVTAGRSFENENGYLLLYGGVLGSTKSIKVAESGTTGTVSLLTKTEKAGGFTAGLNIALRENFVIGPAYQGTWNRSTPGNQKTLQVCQIKNVSTTTDGATVQSSKCEDRYAAPLSNDYLSHLRFDVLKNFDRPNRESYGIIGGISADHRSSQAWTYNVVVGPVIHPKGRPHQALLAVLATVTDFTDANNQGRTFSDKFGITLHLGVPLGGF